LQVRAAESESLRAGLNDFLCGKAQIEKLSECDGCFPI